MPAVAYADHAQRPHRASFPIRERRRSNPLATEPHPSERSPLMGGFAVAIDWKRNNVAAQIGPMLALIPHRATHGTATEAFEHATLGEARTDPHDGPTTVTSVGRFSIVGDLRLWDRHGLCSRAGGSSVTEGMSDRELILAAYARTGIGFLDDLDGDFALRHLG